MNPNYDNLEIQHNKLWNKSTYENRTTYSKIYDMLNNLIMVTSMGFEPMYIAVKGRRVKPLHQLAMLLGFNIKYFLRTSYRAKERKYLRCISNLTCITNFWQPHLTSLGH